MKKIYRTLWVAAAIAVLTMVSVRAGNKDRSGQAAAPQLLINPWGATSGWGNAGVSSTKGIEATFANVAGIAFVRKTQIGYSNTMYNVSANVMLNSLGIMQNLGKDRGRLGLSAMLMNMGKVPITTVDQPEGGMGTFSPIFVNLAVSYGYSISDFVHIGASAKIIHESIHNVSATGFALDIGVQYVAGRNEELQLGIVLKNLGLPIRYKGDGMSNRVSLPKNAFPTTFEIPSAEAEMPVLLALGASYDFLFSKSGTFKDIERKDAAHRLTFAISFIANAYSNDQFNFGMEYSLMDYFQVRGGYTFEKNMFNAKKSTNWMGPSFGVSLLAPLNKKDEGRQHQRIAIDYAYRFTVEWKGCHTIGARIIL